MPRERCLRRYKALIPFTALTNPIAAPTLKLIQTRRRAHETQPILI